MSNDRLVSLAMDLCSLDATTGQEKASVDYLEKLLVAEGWRVERQAVEPGRDNLWAFSSEAPIKILLTTHVDTVPDYISPKQSEDGRTLFGRGVCDAKGIAACMVVAAEKLRKMKLPVALLFVVGEETNSIGAKTAAKHGVKAQYVINGEPTQLKLVRAMKGIIVFELQARGIAAHSAYPDAGSSAVHQLLGDLHALMHTDWPIDSNLGKTTCNIGVIHGGKAHNVIADEASAKISVRTTINSADVIELIKSKIHPKTSMTLLSTSDPQSFKIVDGMETDVVSFGSDVPYLKGIGEPLLLGPGSILDAHTIHEQVQVEDLHRAVDLYVKLGVELCKS